MRRLPSWLIVGAVGILLTLAAADAIRPNGESGRRSETSPAGAPDLRGVLVLGGPDCSVAALRLPGLVEQQPPRRPDCGDVVWSRDGSLAARCTQTNGTEILTADLAFTARAAGCAASWRRDGALTLIREGDIVLWRRRGRERTAFTHTRLVAQLKGRAERLLRPQTYRFTEVRWADEASFATILVGKRPWETGVALFTNGILDWFTPLFGAHPEDLRVSPAGKLAFARTVPVREYRMLSRSGTELSLPRIGNADALAWSPDERWVAIATGTTTFIARTGKPGVVRELSVGGASLEWLP
jgi:hypothetical protein